MIEIGSGSVSMRKLQSTTFGLRPKACGGLKKLESVFVAESTKAIEAWLDGNPNQTVYAVALHELYRELEGQIVLPQLAINSLQVRMALSTAICENFHRNRSSAVAVASSDKTAELVTIRSELTVTSNQFRVQSLLAIISGSERTS